MQDGLWAVQSTVPGGGTYTGHIRVTTKDEVLTFEWLISDGTYFGDGLVAPDGVFVSCGRTPRDNWLLVVDTPSGVARLTCDGALIAEPVVTSRGDARFAIGHPVVTSLSLAERDGALLATLRVGDHDVEGLAWQTDTTLAVAWGPDITGHVILFYPASPDPDRRTGYWRLAQGAEVAVEDLQRT